MRSEAARNHPSSDGKYEKHDRSAFFSDLPRYVAYWAICSSCSMQCPSASITRKRFMFVPPATWYRASSDVRVVSPRSVERQSAVDGDRLPGDEGGIVRGEEHHGADEIPRLFGALDALRAQHGLALLGSHRLPRDLGEGGAGGDRVDGDPEITELAGHRARHREDRAFRGDVVQVMRAAHEDGGGRDVDNPSASLLPHLRNDRLAGQPDTSYVDGHQLVPLRLTELPEGLHLDSREDGRVVDQNVDPAELAQRRGDHFLTARFVGHVGSYEDGLATGRQALLGDRFALGLGELGHDDARALLDQPMSICAADSLAGAGDDCDPILELHRRCSWRAPSSARSICGAATIDPSLPRATSRGRYFIPQSGARMTFSGLTKVSARLMRATTASGVSTIMSSRSRQPTMICLPSSFPSTAQSSFDCAVSTET